MFPSAARNQKGETLIEVGSHKIRYVMTRTPGGNFT